MRNLAEKGRLDTMPASVNTTDVFKSGISRRLKKVIQFGFASVEDIASMINNGALQDLAKLSLAIAQIKSFLLVNGVIIVAPELKKGIKKALKPLLPKKQKLETATEESDNGQKSDWEWRYDPNIKGMYMNDIGMLSKANNEEVKYLSEMIQNHSDINSRNRLVEANLRLVLKFASFAASHPDNELLDFLDLVQEGNLGLIKAAERYRHDKGAFSTYAIWWIKAHTRRAVMLDGKLVQVPVHRHEEWSRIKKAIKNFRQEVGRFVTEEELASALSASVEDVRVALNQMKGQYISLEEPLSQNRHNSEDDSFAMSDIMVDEKAKTPEEIFLIQEESDIAKKMLARLLSKFSLRKQQIFRARYGLNESLSPKTLEEVGLSFGITREGVRQIVREMWSTIEKSNPELVQFSGIQKMIGRRIERLDARKVKKLDSGKPRRCWKCKSPLSIYNDGNYCFRHPLPPKELEP